MLSDASAQPAISILICDRAVALQSFALFISSTKAQRLTFFNGSGRREYFIRRFYSWTLWPRKWPQDNL